MENSRPLVSAILLGSLLPVWGHQDSIPRQDAIDQQALVNGLRAKEAKARLRAIYAIEKLTRVEGATMFALAHAQGDKDSAVTYYASEALSAFGARAVPCLVELSVRSEDETLRTECIRTLSRVARSDIPESVRLEIAAAVQPHLFKEGDGKNGDAAYWAEECLVNLGRTCLPFLRSKLTGGGKAEQVKALSIIGRLGSVGTAAIDDVEHLLESRDEHIAIAAVKSLGEIGQCSAKGLSQIVHLLKAGGPGIRVVVERSLVRIGPAAGSTLLGALEDGELSGEDASAAFSVLKAMGPTASPLVPRIIGCLMNGNPAIVRLAIEALETIGVDATHAEVLVSQLGRHAGNTERKLERLVASLNEEALPPLRGVLELEKQNGQVRLSALRVVEQLGRKAKALEPTIYRLLQSDDKKIFAGVRKALGAIGSEAKGNTHQKDEDF